jgi:hypothetical protein
VINVVEELRNSRKMGAYNADGVLAVMVGGLEEELDERLNGKIWTGVSPSLPSRNEMNGGAVRFESVNEAESIGDLSKSFSRRRRVRDWLKANVLGK